jgi:hypothetical protein
MKHVASSPMVTLPVAELAALSKALRKLPKGSLGPLAVIPVEQGNELFALLTVAREATYRALPLPPVRVVPKIRAA